jgi:hypothetical protein
MSFGLQFVVQDLLLSCLLLLLKTLMTLSSVVNLPTSGNNLLSELFLVLDSSQLSALKKWEILL